jgi:hypothetical protein
MKYNNISTTPKIRLTGDTGTVIEIDVSALQATDEQKTVVQKFISNGDLSVLNDKEKELIKDLKAYVGLGTVSPAFIVRFDTTWIKIDE